MPFSLPVRRSSWERITPTGTITDYPLTTANAYPHGITTGPDGNLWFTDSAGVKIGRITSGKAAAVLSSPIVSGSVQAGSQQQCSGDQWATWAGDQPTGKTYTWALDGQTVATGRIYTPTPAEVGKSLTCTVKAAYTIPPVPVVATSEKATVVAQITGPPGATGTSGATGTLGATGPKGDPGQVRLVTCTKKKGKKKCTTKVVTGTLTFTTSGKAKAMLVTAHRTYRVHVRTHGASIRISSREHIKPGHYMLVAGGQALRWRV